MDMSETDRINISKNSLASLFYEKTGGKNRQNQLFRALEIKQKLVAI